MSLPFSQLDRICQKSDHPRIGTWMARRIARPAALRITSVVAPWGVSANAATLLAWACAVAAAAAWGLGSLGGWLLGAALLQTWYLLDHVDGQLARLHGTASLDGVQLDYLMHHTVNLLVPVGVGAGLFVQTLEPAWALAGLAWGLGLLLVTLHHDTRYKAFFQRLQRLHGHLQVEGGGGGRPESQPPIPREPLRLAAWTARKACEIHVVMNILSVLAVATWLFPSAGRLAMELYLGAMAPGSLAVAAWIVIRSQRSGAVEREFAAWYQIPDGRRLVLRDGEWIVENTASRPPYARAPEPLCYPTVHSQFGI